MPKIIPLRELKNASKISQMAHESNEPIFITKNGKSDMVILSSQEYDKLNKKNNYDFKVKDDVVSEPDELLQYMMERDKKPIYSILELKQTLSPIFKRHKVKKAILFGSYVKGTADTRSDIDLVVDTDLTGHKYYGLLGEICNSLRFPVDMIAKSEIHKGSDFEKEIENTGVTIYG